MGRFESAKQCFIDLWVLGLDVQAKNVFLVVGPEDLDFDHETHLKKKGFEPFCFCEICWCSEAI